MQKAKQQFRKNDFKYKPIIPIWVCFGF